jgi:hypothetical protein
MLTVQRVVQPNILEQKKKMDEEEEELYGDLDFKTPSVIQVCVETSKLTVRYRKN